MTVTVDVGVDLGTTVTKAVALGVDGAVLARASVPTHWEHPRPEWTERDPDEPGAAVDRLLADLVDGAGDVVVRSVGFCSIAETGTLLDGAGRARSRLVAWHDPRGARQAADLPPDVAAALPGRTGHAVSSVATLFKLLWLRDEGGVDLDGLQWLGLPELVVHRLGGARVAERSLLGRTALFDIHDDTPYRPAFEALGVGPGLVPPRVAAGAAVGRVRADHPVERVRGAVLTVAGHDHLVAAAALGAGRVGSLCDSMGTAEALVAAVAGPPAPDAVSRLVARGISVYPHVVAGTTCLLGAVRTGLVLGSALDALGARSTDERFALDRATRPGTRAGDVVVEGLQMGEDHVATHWPPGTPAAEAWAGVLAAARAVVSAEVRAIREAGPAVDELVVTGGWANLPTVLASRHGLAGRTTHVTLEEPGATGAALLARWAATAHPDGSDPTTHPAPPATWFSGGAA
jgi:sugar (pentulose or hexulose) kinase